MFKTPGIGTYGVFTAIAPFVVASNIAYRVEAHRSINEYITGNESPFDLIYVPLNLTIEQYQTDVGEGVIILVLVSDEGHKVLLPNKYLASYPTVSIVPHDWVVASISLGMLPKDYDLVRVRQAITQAVSDYTGVEASVFFSTKKTSRAVTEAEAAALANVRDAAIANRQTPYAEKVQLLAKIAELEQQVNDLIEIIETP